MNLTQEEYKQLESISVLYVSENWIARSKSNCLYAYSNKPFKNTNEIFDTNGGTCEYIHERFLKFITYENSPINIIETLYEGNYILNYYNQYEAIKILFPHVKWIKRDKDNELCGFVNKPLKGNEFEDYEHIAENALRFLTWESEPLNIDEALKNRSESE